MDILPGFLTIMTVHFMGVISPGPDFAIVVRNSLLKSRKQALFTGLGVSTGLLIHISYCIFGLGIIISSSPKIFALIKNIGGAYLLYLSYKSLRAAKNNPKFNENKTVNLGTNFDAFLEGFLCNVLNVKAMLFILFLFSMVVEPQIPNNIKIFYGIIMVLIALIWFACLTFLISLPKFKKKLFQCQKYINLLFGLILGFLGIFVLVDK